VLPAIPEGVQPVLRFKIRRIGAVVWDVGQGRIEISNDELDDLVISPARWNSGLQLCVVVDDSTLNHACDSR
jgi:glutamyl-tRNA synthetase